MEQKKNYRKIDDALCQSLEQLWDDCFGDLPLLQQRMLKTYGMRNSKEAFCHKQHAVMKPDEWKNIYVDEDHFAPQSVQVQIAQQTVDDIIKKFKKGKSRAAHYLRHFLKDKKIKVSVCKDLSRAGSFGGCNPVTKELYIDIGAGLFYYAKMNSEMCNKDNLAVILGHEIGHAIEKYNRSLKCEAKTVYSDSWGIESFCDMMGYRLATDAGYTLMPQIKMICRGMEKGLDPVPPNPHPPLKSRLDLAKFCQQIFVNDDRKETLFDDKVMAVQWDAEEDLWTQLKKLSQDKRRAK